MAKVAPKLLSNEARQVLERCIVDDARIVLPAERLDVRLYKEVNAALEHLGGKWNRREKAHVFTEMTGDVLADAFYDLVSAGAWTPEDTHDFFPTPDALVHQMIARAELEDGHRVLEPSAGAGHILMGLAATGLNLSVDAIEINQKHTKMLTACRYSVLTFTDFLTFSHLEPGKIRFYHATTDTMLTLPVEDRGMGYDRILMNPPFSKGQAVKHVQHAIGLLKPGGVLVAIMPNGIVQRQDRAHRELRQMIMQHGSLWPIEDGAFKGAGTMVRTVMLRYQKPAETKQAAILAPSVTKTNKEPVRRFRRLGAVQ